jgi:hypothetical protein
MREDNDWARLVAPVLGVDFGSIFCGDKRHDVIPVWRVDLFYILVKMVWTACPRLMVIWMRRPWARRLSFNMHRPPDVDV